MVGCTEKVQHLRRCFPTKHTLTQGSLHYRLATLGYQKRNTYGVETFILQYNQCQHPNK